MNLSATLKHPSAFIPITMSLVALAIVLMFVAVHGPAPQADEGMAAHLWQLLMAGQAPFVVWFAIRWVPQSPKRAMAVLFMQGGAALAAVMPVFWLGW